MHVVDPGVPLETLVVSPDDLWRTQPSVRKVINFAARNLASVPVHAYLRVGEDSRERLPRGHELSRLLRRPAPFTTPYRFWHTIHVDGMLYDRWLFTVLQATDTEPAMLFRIPPTRYRILHGEYGEPHTIVVWGKDSQEYHLDPDSCVFDSGYSSAWGDPVPPAESLAALLNESNEAIKYRRELFKNGAQIGGVIERPHEAPKWTDQAWNRFAAQFAEYKAGGGKQGGVPLLEDGMKFKTLESHSPQSLETLELRKLTDAEVASFWHIPPELVGAREGTFSNLDAFNQSLWSIALGPTVSSFEQALDVMLTTQMDNLDLDKVYIECMVEAKLRGSFADQLRSGQAAVGAPYMTRNEYRAKMNMSAIEGGDELITPLNVVSGGLASPVDTAPNNPGNETSKGRTKSDDEAPAWTRDMGSFKGERDNFDKRLQAHWLATAKSVAKLATEDGSGGKADVINPATASLFDVDEFAKTATPIIKAHMQRLAEIGAWDVLAMWDPKAEGWGPDMIEAWIAKAAATNAERYAKAAQQTISGVVDETAEMDVDGRVVAFGALTTAVVAGAAVMAFATEARSFGSIDAAKKAGMTTKTWLTTSRNPRPSHASMSGEQTDIDGDFSNGMAYPGAASPPEEFMYCQCVLKFGKD